MTHDNDDDDDVQMVDRTSIDVHVDPGKFTATERVFDTRVAQGDQYSAENGDDGESWRLRTRGYWISKCPVIPKFLKWIEDHKEHPVVAEELNDKQHMYGGVPAGTLSYHMWGYLNLNLKGKAQKSFHLVAIGNGAEAWRKLVYNVRSQSELSLRTLKEQIEQPPAVENLNDVEDAVEQWEAKYLEYQEGGGPTLNDTDLKLAFQRLLPREFRRELWLRWDERVTEGGVVELKRWVKKLTHRFLDWEKYNGTPPKVKPAAAHVAEYDDGEIDELGEEATDAEILAAYRQGKGGGKGGGRGKGTGKGDRRGQEGSERVQKCANCGKPGHKAQECRGPKRERSERTCFTCGKPGHEARFCPEKKDAPAKEGMQWRCRRDVHDDGRAMEGSP